MTSLNKIVDLDGYGWYERRMLEQLQPWCKVCNKSVTGSIWMEPKNAKDWLTVHWRKHHEAANG